MSREVFDTAERALNAESGHTTVWSNLGYWRDQSQYPKAAEALARLLADAVDLGAQDAVLDLGFGMGEQLRLWRQAYDVQTLHGVNPSASQNAVARQCVADADYQLSEGLAETVLPLPGAPAFSKVLMLDCAYHFMSRATVLGRLRGHLTPDARVGLTDLYLPRAPSAAEAMALRGMCALSRIPYGNLLSREAYCQQLVQAGLRVQRFTDITAEVFAPFAAWWRRYGARHGFPLRDRLKFATTARFIAAAARRATLGYALVVARPLSDGGGPG